MITQVFIAKLVRIINFAEILLIAKSVTGFAGRFKAGARTANSGLFMLSIEQCKKILGGKAKNYTDEQIETIRDELYVAANLSFGHWQKNCSSAKPEKSSSFSSNEKTTKNL